MPEHAASGHIAIQLLTACISAVTTGDQQALDAAQAGPRPDAILFLTLVLEHNLAGIASRALAAAPVDMVPPVIRAQLDAHTRHAGQANLASLRRTGKIAAAMQRADVPFMPLKGPWLCLRCLDDLAARPSRDIDFLVPLDRMPTALAVLDSCGYDADHRLTPTQFAAELRNNCEFIFFHRDDASAIEPHWAMTPRSLAVTIDMPALWQRAAPISKGSFTFVTLAPEDEALLLCLHGGKEEWTRLKWLADLSAFIAAHPDLDWPTLRQRAADQHALGYLLLGIRLLEIALGQTTPLSALAAASSAAIRHADSAWQRILDAATMQRGCPRGRHIQDITRLRLDVHRRWGDKLRVVIRSLFTARRQHYLMLRLPDRLAWLYPLLKFGHDTFALPVWRQVSRLVQAGPARPDRRA